MLERPSVANEQQTEGGLTTQYCQKKKGFATKCCLVINYFLHSTVKPRPTSLLQTARMSQGVSGKPKKQQLCAGS